MHAHEGGVLVLFDAMLDRSVPLGLRMLFLLYTSLHIAEYISVRHYTTNW